jgi:hypothetical protein
MTTPTVNETDTTNMPGVYELLLDEDMTIGSGHDTEEMCFHITQADMAPVTRTIELYRPKITAGNTLDVTATGAAGIDWGNIENKTTANDLSGTDIQLVDTTTTNTDMRGTDSALLASSAPTNFGDMSISVTTGLVDITQTAADKVWSTASRILTASTNFNDLSAAEVNTEVDTALTDIHLDHLLATDYDPASKPGTATALLNELVENNAGVSRFTSASLDQAWSVGTRVLTAGTNLNDVAATDIVSGGAITTSGGAVSTVTTLTGHTAQTGDSFAILGTPTDFGSGTSTIAANLQDMADDGTAVYDRSTDSLQALRDRGDAAWTTGAGGTPPTTLQNTTIATLASQTSFTLTAGSADNNAYTGAMAVVEDSATATQKAVGLISNYVGSTKTVTLDADPGVFTMAIGDTIDIIAQPKQLPDAIADAAGGLPISDAGGLDLDAMNVNINDIETDTADMQPRVAAIETDTNELQGDWTDGGRLDTIIDSILTDTGTTLDTKLNDIQGATFSSGTDSLEAIRDRGDAAWTTGAGGADKLVLQDTTIATLASQTEFTLTAGSTDNDAYNNCTIVIEDVSTATQKAVGMVLDYTGSTKTVFLKEALAFTIATTDKVYILAENSLKSTVANRQLDVTATGAAGIDWGNVENPTTALDLSGTDIQLVDTTTTNTDMVTDVSSDVTSIKGVTDQMVFTVANELDVNTVSIENFDPTDQINGACDISMTTYGLDHLITNAVVGANVANNSIIARMVSSSATADWDSFDNTTDSLQANRDAISGLNDVAATDIVSGGAINTTAGAVDNVTLTATTTTNTDMRGTESAALASVCTEARLAELDSANLPTTIDNILTDTAAIEFKKNTAYSNFMILMTDSTDDDPATGLTVSGTRSIDGAAFAALANSITEVSGGWYKVDLAAADLNGDSIAIRFTATGANDLNIFIATQ